MPNPKPDEKKLRKSGIGNVIDNKAHPIVNPKMTVQQNRTGNEWPLKSIMGVF